jgi:hypothetical protein
VIPSSVNVVGFLELAPILDQTSIHMDVTVHDRLRTSGGGGISQRLAVVHPDCRNGNATKS